MTPSDPPGAAKWILEKVRFENWSDALVGDLLETYRSQKRSKAWFYRQVLAAVTEGFLSELRQHWVLTIRAILTGLWISYLVHMLGHELVHRFRQTLEPLVSHYVTWFVVSLFCGVLAGWFVGIFHRKHQNAMMLAFALSLVIWESLARFYISRFDLRADLPFAVLFYPAALLGVLIAGALLQPKIRLGNRSF